MKRSRASLIAVLALIVGFTLACGKATGIPGNDSASTDDPQQMPFDREPGASGISPTLPQVLAISKLPAGTPVTIRLQSTLSSASSNAGDTFEGTLDDPIIIDGQTAISRGVAVRGRVLSAKASGRLQDPGYLRIALVSLNLDGKPVAIETSSLFVKGGSHEKRDWAIIGGGKGALVGSAVGAAGGTATAFATDKKEVSFGAERRLTFRLAQAADLH